MMWVGNLLQPSLINLSNAEAFLVCLSAQLVKCWIWRARQYLWEIPHEFVFMMRSQSCPALCDPTDCSPPGSSVHGISQARISQVALSYSKGSFPPRDWTHVCCVSCIGRLILYPLWPWESPGHSLSRSFSHTPSPLWGIFPLPVLLGKFPKAGS